MGFKAPDYSAKKPTLLDDSDTESDGGLAKPIATHL